MTMIQQDIQTALTSIQQQEDVRIVYACEFGQPGLGLPLQRQ